jgi:hypothetical protein
MTGDGNGTRRSGAGSNERLLTALAAGYTIGSAATQANMSERTAHRRIREPGFRQRLDELRANTLSVAADRLAALAIGASITLGEIMTDVDVPPAVRVAAAREILRATPSLWEAASIEQRLGELEAVVEAQQSGLRSA